MNIAAAVMGKGGPKRCRNSRVLVIKPLGSGEVGKVYDFDTGSVRDGAVGGIK